MGLLVACVVTLVTSMPATAQDAGDPSAIRPQSAEYSPYLHYDYPDRVFFGDTHVHTSYSTVREPPHLRKGEIENERY